jgi:hypothetical protein
MRLLVTLICGVSGVLLAPVMALAVTCLCFESDDLVGPTLLFTPVLWIAGYFLGVIGSALWWDHHNRASCENLVRENRELVGKLGWSCSSGIFGETALLPEPPKTV